MTGDFYRNFTNDVLQLQKDGHYLGPHSDKHLLYADWEDRSKTLVTKSVFIKDINSNYATMKKRGIKIQTPKYFMPSYEWYNNDILKWSKTLGLTLINFTPGTSSNADYTTPDMKNYQTSKIIYDKILSFEAKNNLNGFLLLLHIGTDPKRTDKFYFLLEDLIKELKTRAYPFSTLDQLLKI